MKVIYFRKSTKLVAVQNHQIHRGMYSNSGIPLILICIIIIVYFRDEYAELIQVSWLEVSGKVSVERGKTYNVKFDVEVKANGFGWENTPVLVMAKIGKKGSYQYKEVRLACGKAQTIPEDYNNLTVTVGGQENDLELHFGLYEVWSGKWKGGLIIKKAEVKVT